MKNGQLKPSYLEQYFVSFGQYPKVLTLDAGYGSEENYELLNSKAITGYVKYGMFDKEQNQISSRMNAPHAIELKSKNAAKSQKSKEAVSFYF